VIAGRLGILNKACGAFRYENAKVKRYFGGFTEQDNSNPIFRVVSGFENY
jgi:hypothetical protein